MVSAYLIQHSPNASKATTKETTNATGNEVHVTKDRGIRTSHKFGGEVPDNRFPSNHKGKTDDKKERGPHNLQLIRKQEKTKIWFCIVFTYFIS